MSEDDRENVIQQGIAAWNQLKKSWEHWRMVGKALLVGREWAMHHAGTNKPEGKGYNLAFGAWLEKYKLNDIDQGDRKRLFEVMDKLAEIEEWRAGLTEGERRKLNHPSTVLRRWKKATQLPSEEKPKKATLSDSVRDLDTRVYDLTEEKKELEASYEQLKSENETLRAEAAELEKRVKELLAENMEYVTAKIEAEARVTELETGNREMIGKLGTLRRERGSLEKINAILDADKGKLRTEKAELRTENERLERLINQWVGYLERELSNKELSDKERGIFTKVLEGLQVALKQAENQTAEAQRRAAS